MEIKNFELYRDGGTIEITTQDGDIYCFDYRCFTTTEGALYDGFPKKDNSNLIENSSELEQEILDALKNYHNDFNQKSIDYFLSRKMKIEINKQFVPYHLALKLKEIGFNKPCINWYSIHGEDIELSMLGVANPEVIETMVKHPHIIGVKAPLWQQAFDWFREKYNIHIAIQSFHCVTEDKPFSVFIDYQIGDKWDYYETSGENDFKTYEDAQLSCLHKLIEIVKNGRYQ